MTAISIPDLSEPLRAALIEDETLANMLPAYKDSKAVFTKRPIPEEAPDTVIVISPDITVENVDGIRYLRPIITRDITVYGPQASYREVEELARQVQRVFHNTRRAIVVPQWGVLLVTTTGPVPAPADDDKTIARAIQVRVALNAKG